MILQRLRRGLLSSSVIQHNGLELGSYMNYLTFQSFECDCTWWWLSQKPVVGTKFDIYVFSIQTRCLAKSGDLSTW